MKQWLLVALLPLLLGASDWPTNVINVDATTGAVADCRTGTGNPSSCCTGVGTSDGTCNAKLDSLDITTGLKNCSTANGCILNLAAGTFVDAEFDIYGGTPSNKRGGGLQTNGFTNGLIIQGQGIGITILKSTIPPKANVAGFGDILSVTIGGGITASEFKTLRVRDLTFDGQSQLQPSPNNASGAKLGDSGVLSSESGCVVVNSAGTVPFMLQRYERIRCQNTVGNGMQPGARGNPSPAGSQAIITDSEFSHHGCHNTFSSTVGEVPCGCDTTVPGEAADCYGWNAEANSVFEGLKHEGYAVSFAIGRHDLAVGNFIEYTTKYAMQWFGAVATWNADGTDSNPGRLGFGGRAHRNTSNKTMVNPFNCNACTFGWISNNTITNIGLNGGTDLTTHGIGTTGGVWGRSMIIENNTVTNPGFAGIELDAANGPPYPAGPMIISGNIVTNACDRLTVNTPLSNTAAIQINIGIKPTSTISGDPANYAPFMTPQMNNLVVKDNVLVNNHCMHGLMGGTGVNQRGSIINPIIQGGDYSVGSPAVGGYPNNDDHGGCGGAGPANRKAACINNMSGLTATNVCVSAGDWKWGHSYSPSTPPVIPPYIETVAASGTCSGFVLAGGATITNASGNASLNSANCIVGAAASCGAVAGGTTLPFPLPAVL